MLQGVAQFPGVRFVSSATISLAHGISPGVCALEIAPQAELVAESGQLDFTFGATTISWKNCKIDYASLEWNGRGQIIRLNVLDRRWKWAFGQISGRYNVYRDDGEIVDGTEKKPAELATLCLEAMGEKDFLVGDLPDAPRIEVDWDYTNPAEALARLCDTLGFRVVLQPDDRVAVRKLGVGDELPGGAVQENAIQINPPELPDKIGIVGGAVRYQDDIWLDAVGIDSDDARTVVPIDDLAYKPAGGWGAEFACQFANVLAEHGEVAWELAKQSVFRMYRISFPCFLRGWEKRVEDIDHLVVTPEQCATYETVDKLTANKRAQIVGVYYRGSDTLANTDLDDLYELDFILDPRTGTVTFRDPVFRTTTSDSLTPDEALIKLRTAYSVRTDADRALVRTTRERATGGQFGTPTAWYERPELVLNYIDGKPQNAGDVQEEADRQLDAIMESLKPQTAHVRRYAGLVPITLDGAIQHAVYSVGPQGATTTISRNTEQREYVIPFRRRRLVEEQRDAQRRLVWARVLRELS